jgi:two-component system nitrate/nitrite sensor histidine kinase NarX
VQLLRILQEAFTNIRKHAHAGRAQVVFAVENDCLNINVQDDGWGFDPATVAEDSDAHVGLRVMRERAAEIGGSIQVHSETGKGTRVVISMPITKRWNACQGDLSSRIYIR